MSHLTLPPKTPLPLGAIEKHGIQSNYRDYQRQRTLTLGDLLLENRIVFAAETPMDRRITSASDTKRPDRADMRRTHARCRPTTARR